MDILLFAVFLFFALAVIAIDFYKKVYYMGVLGGIILILLGIFLSVDGVLTLTFCG